MQQPLVEQAPLLNEPAQSTKDEFTTDKPSSNDYLSPIDATTTTKTTTATAAPAAQETEISDGALAGLFACACCAAGCVLCCGVFSIALSLSSLIIPILEIYFGRKYQDQCPAEPDIPHYLFLAGLLGLVPNILSAITSIATTTISVEKREKSKLIGTVSIVLRVVAAIANFALVIFLIYLGFLTFGIYSKVQYKQKEETGTYCHKRLYKFTMFIIILNIISSLILCCSGSGVPAKPKEKPETTAKEPSPV
jgi:uncharacterized RDD family membrane protein YckC